MCCAVSNRIGVTRDDSHHDMPHHATPRHAMLAMLMLMLMLTPIQPQRVRWWARLDSHGTAVTAMRRAGFLYGAALDWLSAALPLPSQLTKEKMLAFSRKPREVEHFRP